MNPQQIISIRSRVPAFFCLCAICVLAVFRAKGEVTEGQKFRDFLSDPPPIKMIVFGVSGENYRMIKDGKDLGHPKGTVMYEAGLQGESFYLKMLTNAPFAHPGVVNGTVYGRSRDKFWKLMPNNVDIYFADTDPSANTNGPNAMLGEVQHYRDLLTRALQLGIEHLVPGTLQWLDQTVFTADSAYGNLNGRITTEDDGLPMSIQFTYEKLPGVARQVVYRYSGAKFPPHEIVGTIVAEGKTIRLATSTIEELIVGSEAPDFRGYLPTDFRSTDKDLPINLLYYTNNINHQVNPDGTLTPVPEMVPNLANLQPQKATARVVLWMVVIGLFSFFCLQAARWGKAGSKAAKH